MKQLIFTLIVGVLGAYNALSMTNYIFDVELSDNGQTYSLRLDSSGHAMREYDAYVKYATEFEVTDTIRATKRTERGIGTFIEVTARPDDQYINISFSYDNAEFLGLTDYDVKGYTVKQPTFRSTNTTTQLQVWPGQWVALAAIKVRIRNDNPQQSDAAYDAGTKE